MKRCENCMYSRYEYLASGKKQYVCMKKKDPDRVLRWLKVPKWHKCDEYAEKKKI